LPSLACIPKGKQCNQREGKENARETEEKVVGREGKEKDFGSFLVF